MISLLQHYLPAMHRVSGSYFRSRPKRKGHVGRRPTRAVPSAVKKEPKNVTWLPGDDYLLIHSVLLASHHTTFSVVVGLVDTTSIAHTMVVLASIHRLSLIRAYESFGDAAAVCGYPHFVFSF